MRILIVDHNAIDPASRALYRSIAGEGDVDIRLIVPEAWHDNYRVIRARPEEERFSVRPLPAYFHTRTHRLFYRGIGRELREYRPDIVYVNAEPENFQTLQCALACGRHPGVRFVFSTWRNIDYAHRAFPYRLSWLHAAAERVVLRRAYHAVAFVPEAAEIFFRLGFDNVTWIPPEIDTSMFKPLEGPDYRSPGNIVVGYAGRLHALKGLDVLLGAIAALPREFRLVIVGAGPGESTLRRLCTSLGLDSRVEWQAPVPRAEMPGVLNGMDVVVLPSTTGLYWKEQFGRVLAEAMACGVPVVGSDSAGIPAVIGDAGQVVPEGDVRALSAALARAGEDSGFRRQCIESGLLRVKKEYDVPVIAARFLLLLRSLLG